MSAHVHALRESLRQRFPDAAPVAYGIAASVATGIESLDRILPRGGVPRGKLTAWGPRGGAAALVRAACDTALAGGERAAWIDGAGIGGPDWKEGPLLFRATGRSQALGSAEILLRSGAFALVVLAGAEPEATDSVRLTRAAREGGGALVALTHNPFMAALRVTSRILPDSYRWSLGPFTEPAAPVTATIEVCARALGWSERARVVVPVAPYELRLSLDATLVDRRGLTRG